MSDAEEELFVGLDLDDVSAWPVYAVALERARPGSEQLAVGWQQISYYVIYAQRDWSEKVEELVTAMAQSALSSARLGQLIADHVVLDCAADAPAIGVLAADVLNALFGWDWTDHVVATYRTLRKEPWSALPLQPSSDFASPSLRRMMLRPAAPELPVVGPENPIAWREWQTAVRLGERRPNVTGRLARALHMFALDPMSPDTFDLAVEVTNALQGDVRDLARDRLLRIRVAEALKAVPGQESSIWLSAARELLTNGEGVSDAGSFLSAWRSVRALV